MIASSHLAVGAAAGIAAQALLPSNTSGPERLFCAFAAGFVSHLALDAVPHAEYAIKGLKLWLALFIETGLVFALVLSSKNSLLSNSIIFFGMSGGAAPDLMMMSSDLIFRWQWFREWNDIIHHFHFRGQTSPSFTFGYFIQAVVAMFAILFVRSRPAW